MRKYLLLFYTSFVIGLNLFAQPKQEIRAAWLATNYALDWPDKPINRANDTIRQQQDLCRMLDQLQAANFNVVFFQTRIRGDVIYPSKIEPWSRHISEKSSGPGYDPLAFAIEACHRRGLECHVWFVTYPLGLDKVNGRSNNALSILNNESLVKRFQGELYLDPGNPQTNTYLLSLIREIVSQYDIDGFHFDYIRYPDKINATNFPDQDNYRKYGNGLELYEWRRKNINQFVYMAYDGIKALKPWVQVSSSVIGMYQKIPGNNGKHWTAYSSVFQDPDDWLKKGKHDFIVPMMYYSDDLFFPFVGNWQEHSHGRYIVPGIGLYRMDENEAGWNAQTIMDQIRFSRSSQTQGNAYYRTQYLIENRKGIMNLIQTRFYATPSQLPPLRWLDNIPPQVPPKPDAIQEGNVLHLSWEQQEDSEKIYYSIYCSETFPVDTENPANLVATRIHDTEFFLPVDKTKETGYYYLITSSDRYHNESRGSKVVFFYMGALEK